MFGRLFSYAAVLLISCCLVPGARAENIVLLSGQKISGTILDRTALQITVDVQGTPQTFFLGEVASIDGVVVEPDQTKSTVTPAETPTEKFTEKPADRPVRPMIRRQKYITNVRNVSKPPLMQRTPELQEAVRLDALILSMYQMMGKIANTNRNVVATPDGGIIIVSTDKIIKYDKDLNIVKQVNLKTDSTASPPP